MELITTNNDSVFIRHGASSEMNGNWKRKKNWRGTKGQRCQQKNRMNPSTYFCFRMPCHYLNNMQMQTIKFLITTWQNVGITRSWVVKITAFFRLIPLCLSATRHVFICIYLYISLSPLFRYAMCTNWNICYEKKTSFRLHILHGILISE